MNIKTLKSTLDNIARERLRAQEPYCYTCGLPSHDVSHMLSKGAFPAIRWDTRNIHMQCRQCHMRHHQGDDRYLKAFLEEYGQEEYEALRLDGRKRMGRQEMLALLNEFMA